MGVLFEVQSVLFCLFGIGGFRASENTTRKRVNKSFFLKRVYVCSYLSNWSFEVIHRFHSWSLKKNLEKNWALRCQMN